MVSEFASCLEERFLGLRRPKLEVLCSSRQSAHDDGFLTERITTMNTLYLELPQGRLAFDDRGTGPRVAPLLLGLLSVSTGLALFLSPLTLAVVAISEV